VKPVTGLCAEKNASGAFSGLPNLHDAAARGDDLPAAAQGAAEPDDAASDVPASQAAAVIAANYGDCRVDRQRLTDLQAWARQMRLAD